MENAKYVASMIDALVAANVPYMVVGSLSSNVFGVSRSTKDADVVVELGSQTVADVCAHLGPEFQLERQMRFETATGTARYIFQIADNPFQIELFRLSGDPHDQERFRRRRKLLAPQLSREVYLPTVEDVIITKLRWAKNAGRGKDREDVRDVVAVQGDNLDWDYIRGWTEQHGTTELLAEIRRSIPPI